MGKEARQQANYVDFYNDEQFEKDHKEVIGVHWGEAKAVVKEEVERRKNRFRVMAENKENIAKRYMPLHKHLFEKSKLNIKEIGDMKEISDDIFTLPFFDESLCDMLVEEMKNLKKTNLSHSRATSMSPQTQTMLLQEVGLEGVVEEVRRRVEPLARVKYPDLMGLSGLDSAKAFILEYNVDKEMVDKATHFDNAEVTVNISLNSEFQEGELYFVEGGRTKAIAQRKGWAVLHR